MARLQILELPEGANDERAPFVLVVDQYEPRRYEMSLDQTEQPINEFDGIAEKTGARCVLVFEDTVDIPANDIVAAAAPLASWPGSNELQALMQEEIAKTQVELIDALNRRDPR